jgi:hypothetical protein
MLQDAQRHQRGDALPVGRDLVQRVAAVVLRDGLDPLGLVAAKSLAMRRRRALPKKRSIACAISPP